ncbi:MAG: hypothetical protein J6Y70_00490 [Bacilli bacterium]|nr:hypothetical protein [Bacilli bacterium]
MAYNRNYNNKVKKTLNSLINIENLATIDSFNYSIFHNKKLQEKLRYINGDWNTPIFGIDSTIFKYDDVRYIFAKTDIRMELNTSQQLADENKKFENVLVLGHSLNRNDYSYFFPLLDELEIGNRSSNKKIAFVFSIPKNEQSDTFKRNLKNSTHKLFMDYIKSKRENELDRKKVVRHFEYTR